LQGGQIKVGSWGKRKKDCKSRNIVLRGDGRRLPGDISEREREAKRGALREKSIGHHVRRKGGFKEERGCTLLRGSYREKKNGA